MRTEDSSLTNYRNDNSWNKNVKIKIFRKIINEKRQELIENTIDPIDPEIVFED